MERRDFLRLIALSGLSIPTARLLGPSLLKAASSQPAWDIVDIEGDPAQAADRAISMLGGIGRFVSKGDHVVLKPNMSFTKGPEEGCNTNPEVVRRVAELCREAGASRVIVLDFPLRRSEVCLERSGVKERLKGLKKVYVVAIDREKHYDDVTPKNAGHLPRVKIAKDVLRADVLINLPTAKSHSATTVSLGMKGLMGCIWDRGYFHEKTDLHEAVAELATLVRTDLTIVDATWVLHTGGPGGPGRVGKFDTVIAGIDPVAVDAYVTGRFEWYDRKVAPTEVKHIAAAARRGIGRIDMEGLKVKRITKDKEGSTG